MIKKISKILSVILYIMLAVLLIAEGFMAISRLISPDSHPKFLGFSRAVVLTGSMKPEINEGDLLIYKTKSEYEVGDTVIFYDEGVKGYVTHGIVRIEGEDIYTKGTNNNAEDPVPITHEDIHGRVIAKIPGFARLTSYLKTPLGLITVASLLALFLFVPPILKFIFKK